MKEAEKASHTPEPWRYEEQYGFIVGKSNEAVVSLREKRNLIRTVACVNACMNMSNNELEDHGVGGIKQWMDDADETLKAVCDALEDVDYSGRCEQGIYVIKQQRDELLAALTDAVCALEVCGKDFRATEIARQAIAKARGQQ